MTDDLPVHRDVRPIEPTTFPWLKYGSFSFSLAVADETRVWLSGQTASQEHPETGRLELPDGLDAQLSVVWDKIEAIASTAGVDFRTVSTVVEYLPKGFWSKRDAVNSARRTRLGSTRPTVYTVPVDRLIRSSAGIEIEVQFDSRADGPTTWALPLIEPVDGGKVLHPYDRSSQYAYCMEVLAERLRTAGIDRSAVLKLTEFHSLGATDASTVAAQRWQSFGSNQPALCVLEFEAAKRAGQLVCVAATVTTNNVVRSSEMIATDERYPNPVAVEADGLIHLSAVVSSGRNQTTGREFDLLAETERIYNSVVEHMSTLDPRARLVRTNEYVTVEALSSYRNIGDVRRRVLTNPLPASTGLICARVGGQPSGIVVDCTASSSRI